MGSFLSGGSRAVDNILGTHLSGSNATDDAIAAQTGATQDANATQKYMYDQNRADIQPWRQAGTTALTGLQDPNFGQNLQMDPGYQFRLDEGNKAINAAASSRGMGNSGAALKELTRYGQDYASNEYNNAYNRNFNRLSTLAGLGNSANQSNQQNTTNYGNNVSANQVGLGNATAAAQIGSVNRQAGVIGQGAGAAAMAFSDERLKTDIEPVEKSDLEEMKFHLKAYAFKYKSEEFGKGDWVGVMAQDLEKSKLGKTLVVEDAEGRKQIDLVKVLSMFLATMAEG